MTDRLIIGADDVTADERSPTAADGQGRYITCASDIGLRPGQWPKEIDTMLGTTMPLLRGEPYVEWTGSLVYVDYEQIASGLTVRIYND